MRSERLQSSFTAGVISPDLIDRIDMDWYRLGLSACHNAFVHVHGGVSNRPGTHYIGQTTFSGAKSRLFPFVYSDEDAYILEFGHETLRFIRRDGFIAFPPGHTGPSSGPLELPGMTVVIPTPWSWADLDGLRLVQSGDVVFIASKARKLYRLMRFDHHQWTLTPDDYTPTMAPPDNLSGITTNGGSGLDRITYSYVVTSVSPSGEESIASDPVVIQSLDLTDGTRPRITLSWDAVEGAESYVVYKEQSGSGVYGFIGTSKNGRFIDDNIRPDMGDAPASLSADPLDGDNPTALAFHQERLFLAAGQRIQGSQTANYKNFNVSIPTKPSDSVSFTPATRQANEIEHMLSRDDLLVFGRDDVFSVSGSGEGVAITPSSLRIRPQSSFGAASVRPLVVGREVLYVQRQGRRLRTMAYAFSDDGYQGVDLTLRANHIFRDTQIVDMAWAEEPYQILWCVLADGRMAGLTYIQEQQIWAWHTHSTDGFFESIAVIPEDGDDIAYVCVRREIQGVTKRMIERLDPRRFTNARDAFFVDSGIAFDLGSPIEEFEGLDHLEGKEVAILADGEVRPRQTVVGGRVDVLPPASRVTIGLAYTAEVTTLPVTGLGRASQKQATELSIRVQDTRGISVASQGFSPVEPVTQKISPGEPHPLRNEMIDGLHLGSRLSADAQVSVIQNHPLPMTVTSILPLVKGGR